MAKKRSKKNDADADDAPVMAYRPPNPSMHVEGPQAKRLHGLKPGARVKMMVHGVVTDTGLTGMNSTGQTTPTARVEIHRIVHQTRKKKATPIP